MGNFKEKYGPWALVTGASSGIGEASAKLLAQQGMNLVLVARRKQVLDQLSEQLKLSYNISVVTIIQDLTQPDFMDKIVHDTQEIEIGLLINSAGLQTHGAFIKAAPDFALQLFKLNTQAPMQLALHFAKKMKQRGKGGIIFMGSLIGHVSAPYYAHYAASKAYILSLGESLHYELKKHGVDVIVISPGVTDTHMTTNMLNNGFDLSWSPKFMSPEKVARISLQSLGKKPSVIPGFSNNLVSFVSKRLLSRKATAFLFGKIFEKRITKELL